MDLNKKKLKTDVDSVLNQKQLILVDLNEFDKTNLVRYVFDVRSNELKMFSDGDTFNKNDDLLFVKLPHDFYKEFMKHEIQAILWSLFCIFILFVSCLSIFLTFLMYFHKHEFKTVVFILSNLLCISNIYYLIEFSYLSNRYIEFIDNKIQKCLIKNRK